MACLSRIPRPKHLLYNWRTKCNWLGNFKLAALMQNLFEIMQHFRNYRGKQSTTSEQSSYRQIWMWYLEGHETFEKNNNFINIPQKTKVQAFGTPPCPSLTSPSSAFEICSSDRPSKRTLFSTPLSVYKIESQLRDNC